MLSVLKIFIHSSKNSQKKNNNNNNNYSNNLRHCPSLHAWNSIGGSPSHDMSGKSGFTHCLTLIWAPLPQVALQLCHAPQSPQAAEIYEKCDQTQTSTYLVRVVIHIIQLLNYVWPISKTQIWKHHFCFVLFLFLILFCFFPDVLNRIWWYFIMIDKNRSSKYQSIF